jgi:ubiquinone/menaquinone biosynthesis C-methylase UbiE
MKLSEIILYKFSKMWPSPYKKEYKYTGEDFESDEYLMNYALHNQYFRKVKHGLDIDFLDKDILEIGCGHGGISTFMATNMAKSVKAIDLNTTNLAIAEKFKKMVEEKIGVDKGLNVEYIEMNAYEMTFEPESFDIVIADNVFEHFMEPAKVMDQVKRILRPGGILFVPAFPSIYSKHGLHLKHGLKIPWANVFFSEKTICNVMVRLAEENKDLYKIYPGLVDKPTKVKDIRAYKDLNGITIKKFKQIAINSGYEIQWFNVSVPGKHIFQFLFRYVHRIPGLKDSRIADILSINSRSILIKK